MWSPFPLPSPSCCGILCVFLLGCCKPCNPTLSESLSGHRTGNSNILRLWRECRQGPLSGRRPSPIPGVHVKPAPIANPDARQCAGRLSCIEIPRPERLRRLDPPRPAATHEGGCVLLGALGPGPCPRPIAHMHGPGVPEGPSIPPERRLESKAIYVR